MKKKLGIYIILLTLISGCIYHNPNIDNRCNASMAYDQGRRDAICCRSANTDYASECCEDKARVNRAYMRGYHYGIVYMHCGRP